MFANEIEISLLEKFTAKKTELKSCCCLISIVGLTITIIIDSLKLQKSKIWFLVHLAEVLKKKKLELTSKENLEHF